MRVAVIGAGAVGGTLAALLCRAGHDVLVVARGEHAAAIASDGLQLTGAFGDYIAHPRVVPALDSLVELVIVATKAQQAGSAIADSSPWLANTPVVVVQNGLDAVTVGRASAPDAFVFGGLALFAASHLAPGAVEVTAAGTIVIGVDDSTEPGEAAIPTTPSVASRNSSGSSAALDRAATVLGDALPTTMARSFTGAQWTKLVINQVNSLPAITGLSVQAVVALVPLRKILVRSLQEAIRTGIALGVTFESLQGLSDRALRSVARAPYPLAQLLPLAMARRMGNTPNPGSTLQSIRRGQATEIDYLTGAVVEIAKPLGVATPASTALVALVHEVEQSARFLTPEQVVDRVGRGYHD